MARLRRRFIALTVLGREGGERLPRVRYTGMGEGGASLGHVQTTPPPPVGEAGAGAERRRAPLGVGTPHPGSLIRGYFSGPGVGR